MSELYGRHIVYNVANMTFCLVTVGCALAPSLNSLVALRFLQGLAASCSSSHGGGTIADLIPIQRRGAVTSGYTCALLFGPTLGPIFGAYLTKARGWRWVFWVIAIVNAGVTLIYMLTCRETYAPVLLKWKANKLRKETGNSRLRGQAEQRLPMVKLLRTSIVRPTKMLFLSPIVAGLSLYIATVYGQVYLLFSTFAFVFTDQYGFTEENNGLTYLGLAIGMLVSLLVAGIVCDRTYQRLTKKHSAEKPE
jgi:MFS family permease